MGTPGRTNNVHPKYKFLPCSKEHISMNGHGWIRDTPLQLIYFGNSWLDVTAHEEAPWSYAWGV